MHVTHGAAQVLSALDGLTPNHRPDAWTADCPRCRADGTLRVTVVDGRSVSLRCAACRAGQEELGMAALGRLPKLSAMPPETAEGEVPRYHHKAALNRPGPQPINAGYPADLSVAIKKAMGIGRGNSRGKR